MQGGTCRVAVVRVVGRRLVSVPNEMEVSTGSDTAGLRVESFKGKGRITCTLLCCWWDHIWANYALTLGILVRVFWRSSWD